MEFRLGRTTDKYPDGDTTVELLDVLTKDQFDAAEVALKQLEELTAVRRLRDFVSENDKQLITMLNGYLQPLLQKSISWYGVKRSDLSDIHSHTNRLLLNYLSAIKTFLDHTTTFLDRKFGKRSSSFEDFEKMLSYFFDNSFAYRFFYKLRNYAQHVGLPIHGINFASSFLRTGNGISVTLEVNFDRDALLSSFGKWGPVAKDLDQKPNFFKMVPLLFEMTHNISEIERNVELIFKNELLASASYISELIAHIRIEKADIFIGYDFLDDENGKLKNYKQLDVPLDILDFIINELAKEDGHDMRLVEIVDK